MDFNLEFQTKHILNPWSMYFNHVKVSFNGSAILFKIFPAHCGEVSNLWDETLTKEMFYFSVLLGSTEVQVYSRVKLTKVDPTYTNTIFTVAWSKQFCPPDKQLASNLI